MSDSEDYDVSYVDDVGYFYIEDAYGAADELAEHTCPSPVPYDGDDEWDDHSRFTSYWNDLKYNSDSYYDKTPSSKKPRVKATPKSRKKKVGPQARRKSAKKRKVQHTSRSTSPILCTDEIPPVLWMSRKTRCEDNKGSGWLDGGKPVAILADWRERFANVSGFPRPSRPTKLAEIHDAADDSVGDTIQRNNGLSGLRIGSPSALSVQKHELETVMADDDDVDQPQVPGLDQEALRVALRQNLETAGINVKGMDESMLLELAAQIFSNEGDADNIVGEFANSLLERDEDENDDNEEVDGFAGWVAQQVKGKEQIAEADEDMQGALQLPTPSQDSNGVPRSSPRPGKRKADAAADTAIEDDMPRPKRGARSYQAQTAASRARTAPAVSVPARNTGKNKKTV